MAGQPKRRALRQALEARTRALFEDDAGKTHLDYVCAWVAAGRTMLSLSQQLERETKVAGLDTMLGNYLRSEWPMEATPRLEAARREGAHAIMDSTLEISDEPVADNAEASRQRTRIGARQYMAGGWNREQYGAARGAQVAVQVNVGESLANALRARARVSSERVEVTQPLLPGAAAQLLSSSSATKGATAAPGAAALEHAQVQGST